MGANQQYEGEWKDVTDGRYEVCCDCGLTHNTDYRILESRILQRAFIAPKRTTGHRTALRRFKKGIWEKKRKK